MSQDRQESFRSLIDNAKCERIAYLAQLLRLFSSHLARLPASLASGLAQASGAIRLASYVPRWH
jgi:hypothetical protein